MKTMVNQDGDECVLLSRAEYEALEEDAELASAAEAAMARDAGLPALSRCVVDQILAGTLHPLTAWREAHGLTQAALASRAGVRQATISEIEGGQLDPRVSTVKALADALGLDIDDILA